MTAKITSRLRKRRILRDLSCEMNLKPNGLIMPIFGRGGEELLSLREAGMDVEVVPGLASAIAIPTISGIPITMRVLSSSILILTGNLAKADDGSYFNEHERFLGTLVLLMSLTNISQISKFLVEGGMSPEMPIDVITIIDRSQKLKKAFYRLGDLIGAEYSREWSGVVVIGDVVGCSGD